MNRTSEVAAFADAGELAPWWGPEGFSVPRLDFEPRVGADYRIEMQPPAGEPFHLTGEFREERRDLHRGGWTESFDKLERLLG